MIGKYLDTGKDCQVIFHVSRPTKKSSIKAKRERTLADWNEGIQRLKDLGCYRGLRHRKQLPTRGQSC